MEQSEEMPSTSSVGSEGVVDEGVVAAGAPTRTTTRTTAKVPGEGAAANEFAKVYATEEQIRAVFLNRVVSEK